MDGNTGMNRTREERQVEQIMSALGPDIRAALEDSTVTDIMRNRDGGVWVERLGGDVRREAVLDRDRALTVIQTLAAYHGETVTRDRPILSCELPAAAGRARFEANIEPIAPDGPRFSIRKLVSRVISLEEYRERGDLGEEDHLRIVEGIRDHKNIVVAGGTGSGKTTLVNAMLQEIVRQNPMERIFILEDLTELQCNSPFSEVGRATDETPMSRIIRSVLRQRPNRIVIGEVRGEECWELLRAWNTGHPGGVCTIHAGEQHDLEGNLVSATKRIEQLCAQHPACPRNHDVLREVILETVDLIVSISRGKDGRRRIGGVGPPRTGRSRD